jgi:SAM-dependent methyltransferase
VISQEVLEHVKEPAVAMSEIKRVLKKNGKCYIQLPFIIGFHPCPNDYWRFTKQGIVALVEASGLKVIEVGETVGSATGFYRVSVEFLSILFSLFIPKAYKIMKALFSLLLYPVKWLDPLLRLSKESERVSGGYYVICIKE